MKMVIKTLKFSKWSNGIHFYISAILFLGPHMFMHVYIYVGHVMVEEEASCTKHLRKGRNMVHFGHFKSTWKVESKVPLRCLKGAAISNLLDPRTWKSKETSGLEMWIWKSLVYNWWLKSWPWSKQRKMEERKRGQGPIVAEWIGFLWLRMGRHGGGRKTCTVLRLDTKGNDGLFSRIKHILRHKLNVNSF